jgi:hypothetical protein
MEEELPIGTIRVVHKLIPVPFIIINEIDFDEAMHEHYPKPEPPAEKPKAVAPPAEEPTPSAVEPEPPAGESEPPATEPLAEEATSTPTATKTTKAKA